MNLLCYFPGEHAFFTSIEIGLAGMLDGISAVFVDTFRKRGLGDVQPDELLVYKATYSFPLWKPYNYTDLPIEPEETLTTVP